ncbi:MAG TPA: hypothetical protein PK079_20860 [Leptospiraceae bacterium]|nr:hypothetical protein [Leptospiraceae bacterium]HMW08087.1 hypothetical protein [Leptospiraceae bacterium]HMX34850.1 hypothetical protein [Leptospiraceae bacterium]HMY33798.1 hypothetical protein [Leptospiraceae bacterium]HMZ67182.1 hypothetical protein [Leptospiraceae bacterium]
MKQLTLIVSMAMLVSIQSLSAKCQYNSDWQKSDGKRIIVCVKGDSFSDRDKARAICAKIKGSSCSVASSFSSSCSNNECYDENGKQSNSLSGY